MIEKMTEIFLEEADDLLNRLEDLLLELEENTENVETISAVFRIMHTIKGSAGMFGFDAISHLTHQAENAFDEIRRGRVSVNPDLITLTLKIRDHIRILLNDSDDDPAVHAESEVLIKSFQSYVAEHLTGLDDVNKMVNSEKENMIIGSSTEDEKELDEVLSTWRITFEPAGDVLTNGTRPHALLAELVALGTASISPFFSNVPLLAKMDPCVCYMSWEIILTTTKSLDVIQDVFIFLDSSSKVEIVQLVDNEQLKSGAPKRLGEILLEKNVISSEQLEATLSKQKPLGKLLQENNMVNQEDVNAGLKEQKHIREQSEKKNQEVNSQTIKVNSEKLDSLIDLVGELVTFNARLDQLAGSINHLELSTLTEQGERLILELRDTTMDMRMLPIGTIFSRFRRLVRDLSDGMKKDIELITEGAETELDKTVIEKLNDPLIHLIRNSVDHGIELPEVRRLAGKPERGQVRLKAQHVGAFVNITIEDDGAGLDKEKIKAKALQSGLITTATELTEQELYDLVFLPGFSTAEKVTSVSGRGVGMDVVKKDITALGGTVVASSVLGKGTKFMLKLPLTLAIIEGILVELGSYKYVIPLSNVVECLEFERPSSGGNHICASLNIRNEVIPYIDLRTFFEVPGTPVTEQIVIVTDQDSKIGLIIDRVIGNYQTVIKPLGRLYKHVAGLSGATILGDGSVGLILDVFKLSDVIKELDIHAV